MTRALIEVEDLSVEIDGCTILDRVSFTVVEGQLLGVIGPNGAGKSTLLRCLDGLLPISNGSITIAGRPLNDYARRQLARVLSYVPQDDARSLHYSVSTFVEMGRYPHLGPWGSVSAEDERVVRVALEVTETLELAERNLDSLSGGERQRVLIAAALAQGGSILLLDEPTTFLDFRHQAQVLELLDRLRREQQLTIVAATHDLNCTVAVADIVLALRSGRVECQGAPRQILTAEALSGIYDTQLDVVAVPGRDLPLVLPRGQGS